MRKLLAALILIVALAPTVGAARGAASCSVTPNPVIKPGSFTLNVTGLVPFGRYYVRTDWHGQGYGHHPEGFIDADASGFSSWTSDTESDPTNVIPVGSVRVRVYSYPQGSTVARCGFDVI